MLRRPPTNLNRQSEEATILLIREVLQRGIVLSEVNLKSRSCFTQTQSPFRQVYVDALGTTTTYEAYLSSLFPGINFTVTTKADSKFKIVGAASVAAKVTRDACIEDWKFDEIESSESDTGAKKVPTWSSELGSGYPSGLCSLII
jgi:ribonuclease H2 subunit A